MNRTVLSLLFLLAASAGRAVAGTPHESIPILFNDHHVRATPDVLTRGRVLAAQVRNGTLLVPLRAMFEQMGATVRYDAAKRTVTVSKAGATVQVTVGVPEVVVDGQTRPLDVPPIVDRGTVLVPVRVISEGMGAYVLWVPDQHVVVVRYLPATPPASPPPTPMPTPLPTIAPTPTPAPQATPYRDLFVAGDYLISPKVYDEFSPGNSGIGSWSVNGAWEFAAFNIPFMLEGQWQQYQYPHDGSAGALNAPCGGGPGSAPAGSPGCVTIIGGGASLNIAPFTARDSTFNGRLGMKLLKSRVYIDFAYMWTSSSYGYPNMRGFGEGLEKLPDLDRPLSLFGSWLYYPNVKGTIVTGLPSSSFDLSYIVTTYQIGIAYAVGGTPVFVTLGWGGQSMVNRLDAPDNRTYSGPFAGLGLKF